MRKTSILLLATAIALMAVTAGAVDGPLPRSTCVVVEDGWIRMPPVPRPMLAGFGRIANRCKGEQVVVAAHSPRFGEVSLHETRVVDGVSRMREIDRLPLAPGAQAVLQPGGLHLMLMQPDAALAEGERVPLVLVLEDGHEADAVLVVSRSAPVPAAGR